MADVVTRLVVESKEYDNKIARATQGLTQFEKKCREAGGTLEFVEKEDLEFVKALGQMETVSSSATGKLGELKKAFTELSVQYKNLTDAEKQSPYGQALAGSLDQIKGRIGDLGGQLSEVGKEMSGSKGFVDQFTDALGSLGPAGQMAAKLLKGAFGPVGIAIAAVVGIIHQVVEAFKRNEDAMASAERAAAPFKAMWQGIQRIFDKLVPLIADGIEKISNGVQSLFGKMTDWMGRLSQTSLGKKLGLDTVYEQMKKVSSVTGELIGDNKKIADSERALEEQRRRTKEGNAVSSNKISNLRYKASDKSTYSADERVAFLDEAMKEEEKILKRNLDLRQKEYDLIKLKNSLTASGTEDLNEQTDAFVALQQAEQQYNEGMRSLQKQRQAAVNEAVKDSGSAESPAADGSIAAQEDKVKQLTEQWKNAGAEVRDDYKKQLDEAKAVLDDMLGKTAQGSIQFNADGISAIKKELSGALSGATIGGEDYLIATNKIADLTSFENLLKTSISAGIDPSMFEGKFESIKTGIYISDEDWELFVESINEKLEELDLPPIELNVKTGNVEKLDKQVGSLEQNLTGAINVFGQLGDAMQQIDDPGAKVAGIIMGAIANIAGTFAASLKGTFTPWDWIAAAISGTAVMFSTIAAIKSATSGSYASGGIIPGNSYSGDNLTANVNSGELILNRAQQSNIAEQLEGGAAQGGTFGGVVRGADIYLSLSNYAKQSGKVSALGYLGII